MPAPRKLDLPDGGSDASEDATLPAFERIKRHVLAQIASGVWREGDAIPAEESLAKTFGVSRMTVNRALRELSAEQVLRRVQGSGTFVAPRKYQAMLLQLHNIADEVVGRGHVHRSELHRLERCKADEVLAAQFGVPLQSTLFHSVVVHFENDQAIQVEDRYVNPIVAPDYLSYDFQGHTPNEYLMRVAPLQAVRFTIEANMPTAALCGLLDMAATDPCLVLKRQTQSQGHVASCATLWHPASRYQFAGAF
ncbi:histidine utilization repressor [Rhodoferax sp.]|uniref:histidine utilization repressor n=1 Tax=Rhodoferax sp. TaxID=50421 RepID=UPI0025D08A83|nr:histidine utilization repressor [Rhodoferax sp.]